MKLFFKLISMICILFSSMLVAQSLIDKTVSTKNIKVGTYNIMASRMGDTNAIVNVIKKMDVDILGIQEVDNLTLRSGRNFSKNGSKPINQVKYIAKKLNMNYYFCKAIDYDSGEYGTAILSKYPITFYKKMNLPNLDGIEQRSACAVEILVPNYPGPIMAITTHLDYSAQSLRLKQVETLLNKFSAWGFRHAIPIIIGDLNFTPNSNEYMNLMSLFKDTDKKSKLTAPSWNPDRKIDYILTASAQKWDISEVKIPNPTEKVTSKSYAEISDHLPMLVEMRLIRQ